MTYRRSDKALRSESFMGVDSVPIALGDRKIPLLSSLMNSSGPHDHAQEVGLFPLYDLPVSVPDENNNV